SQLGHVCVDRAAHDRCAIAPHGTQQLISTRDAPLATQQSNERIEFFGRQLDPLPSAAYSAGANVDLNFPKAFDDWLRQRRCALSPVRGATDARIDASAKLEHAERLGAVADAAEPE